MNLLSVFEKRGKRAGFWGAEGRLGSKPVPPHGGGKPPHSGRPPENRKPRCSQSFSAKGSLTIAGAGLKGLRASALALAAALSTANLPAATPDAEHAPGVASDHQLAAIGRHIIPKPARIKSAPGHFTIRADTAIRFAHGEAKPAVMLLRDCLMESTGCKLPVAAPGTADQTNTIALVLNEKPGRYSPEHYRLEITSDGVMINAASPAGLVNGIQTLRQLLPVQHPAARSRIEFQLPCGTIDDTPRFRWRGLMLDCSRTFQSVDYLKKTIDRMAIYKLNVLHLHLTDDQGWRMEIRSHPELTAKGARFPEKWHEPAAHQGFYTQAQLKDLVAYAAARNITIVPEIEMPGHTLAVLACYPQLSCTGGPFEIHPFFKGPGIHKDVFCAGNEAVFTFLDEVLGEVCEIFPSEYIHIGGDEAPKTRWKNCPKCQARIKKEGLANEAELQSWFIRRAAAMLKKRGRKMIGWDEILDGGLAPGAAVMSWRGTRGGIAAAKAGHPVVMSPTSHCYFDYPYKRIDTRRAYSFDPVAGLDAARARHVLGIQANFWSHIDREPEKVDAQLFPRLLAIAERAWSPADATDWNDFARRVKSHLARLDQMGVSYHKTER
jgi:hexosaminidase